MDEEYDITQYDTETDETYEYLNQDSEYNTDDLIVPGFTPMEPYNDTDPWVIIDPNLESKTIAQIYQTKYEQSASTPTSNGEYTQEADSLKVSGITFPLIRIGSININADKIIFMRLSYMGFSPTLELILDNSDGNISRNALAQFNNELVLKFTNDIDGTYKKVELLFNIIKQTFEDDSNNVKFECEYKLKSFNNIYAKDITFKGLSYDITYIDDNDNEVYQINKKDPMSKCNTWEMLYTVAAECGLGFAATAECKDLNDRFSRIMYYQTYLEFLNEQLAWACEDEDNILDYWIDLYGYLVLVNVSYVLSSDININQLVIYTNAGIHFTDKNTPEVTPVLVPRVLTNFNNSGISNMTFRNDNLRHDANNEMINTTCYNLWGYNIDKNSVSNINIEMIQNSRAGQFLEEYEQQKNYSIYITSSEDDIIERKYIREAYFNVKRQRCIRLELDKINLGLQRGTLIGLAPFETGPQKADILTNMGQTHPDNNTIDLDTDSDMDQNVKSQRQEMIRNEAKSVPDINQFDMYYIDGMLFEYSRDRDGIVQVLYLLKKGAIMDNKDMYSIPILDLDNGDRMETSYEEPITEEDILEEDYYN